MEQFMYVIPGDPIPLQRARHANGRVYDAQKAEKLHSGLVLVNQHDDRPYFAGPLHLDAKFYIDPPKMSERKKQELWNQPHIYKPDLSNLLKFIEDIGTKVLYHDDATICSIRCTKVYADEHGGRTEFSIKEMR